MPGLKYFQCGAGEGAKETSHEGFLGSTLVDTVKYYIATKATHDKEYTGPVGLRRTSTDQRANIGFLLEEHILPVEDGRKEVQSHQAIRATSYREILVTEHS